MKKLCQFLLFILIILVVGYGGLLTGRHISNINQPLTSEEQRIADEKRAQKLALKEQKELEKELKRLKNKADYIATPSTFGPFIKIQHIDVIFEQDEAIAHIDKNQAKDLQNGQRVVLYDKEDKNLAMPLGGTIQYFNNEDGKRKVVIKLPEGTNTEFLSNKVGVITEQTIVSQRIPLSALTKSKDGDFIVWLAQKAGEKKYSLTSHQVEIMHQNQEFFVPAGNVIEPEALVITNPDKFLRPDREYEVFLDEIDGPIMNPIDQARIDFEQYIFQTRQAQLEEIADDCFNGGPQANSIDGKIAEGSNSSNACGAINTTQERIDNMFQVFESLTKSADQNDIGNCEQAGASCDE